jgi:hypothetical protein
MPLKLCLKDRFTNPARLLYPLHPRKHFRFIIIYGMMNNCGAAFH